MKRRSQISSNDGFTLVEVLVSIMIFSFLFIGVISITYYYQYSSYNNERKLHNEVIIQNVYDIFSKDPYSFKDNIKEYVSGYWNVQRYYMDECPDYYLIYEITDMDIELMVIKDNVEVAAWHRYRF